MPSRGQYDLCHPSILSPATNLSFTHQVRDRRQTYSYKYMYVYTCVFIYMYLIYIIYIYIDIYINIYKTNLTRETI
jgi:hypothetical protein